MPVTDAPAPPSRRPPWVVRLAGAGAVLLALGAGAWLIGASVPDYVTSIALTGGWFLVVGVVAELLSRRRPGTGIALRVHLVAGAVDGDGDGSIDLGRMKGNVGDQQYPIPAGTGLARHATVVIWCRAFSVGFAKAGLDPA